MCFGVSNLLQEEAPASQDFGQGPPSARRTEQCLVSRFFFLSFLDINQMSLSCPFGLGEVRTQSSSYRLTHLDFSEEANEFLCGFVFFTFFIWALFLSKYVLCFTKLHPEKNEKIKMTAIVKKQPVLER